MMWRPSGDVSKRSSEHRFENPSTKIPSVWIFLLWIYSTYSNEIWYWKFTM